VSTFSCFIGTISAQVSCGPTNATIQIAGSRVVESIAQSWAQGYMAQCPTVRINITTGGDSNSGARRVCNDTTGGFTAVDIGMMSRQWNLSSEVNITNRSQGKYTCNIGTKGRNITQIDVAIDAITISLLNGGLASQCLRRTSGFGLSVDQLRWIYSNFTKAQLISAGWDRNSIPLDDDNEMSHKWSEIDLQCPNGEIKLAAPTSLSYKYEFFKEMILIHRTEGIATRRPYGIFQSDNEDEIIEFLENSSDEVYGDAIGILGSIKASNSPTIYHVPIKNKGSADWIRPTMTNIESGIYQPLSRRLYMNVLDTSVVNTGPFISYGFSSAGMDRVSRLGFVPPPLAERGSILARIVSPPTTNLTKNPTKAPTKRPTKRPTKVPTKSPTRIPALAPVNPACGSPATSVFCYYPTNIIFCSRIGRILGLCR
jgi:ABC-type phosphate transport system substrate-binding protein